MMDVIPDEDISFALATVRQSPQFYLVLFLGLGTYSIVETMNKLHTRSLGGIYDIEWLDKALKKPNHGICIDKVIQDIKESTKKFRHKQQKDSKPVSFNPLMFEW